MVLTGDVFRTTDGDGSQLPNVAWLERRFARMLGVITGIEPTIRFRLNGPDEGREVVKRWFKLLDAPADMDGWASTFWAQPTPQLVAAMAPDYEDALVVCYEMSPLLQAVLDRLGVPWIDVSLGPHRFLADLSLCFRCSASMPGEVGADFALGAGERAEGVARVRAHYTAIDSRALDGTAVFFAQMRQDRTLIHGGRFFGPDDAVAALEPMLDGRRLLVKAHPWAPGNPMIGALGRAFGASPCSLPTYAILGSGRDVVALSCSSSVSIEAGSFGLAQRSLTTAVRDWACSGFETVRWGLSRRLWSRLLSSEAVLGEEPWRCNDLRGELGPFGLDPGVWV